VNYQNRSMPFQMVRANLAQRERSAFAQLEVLIVLNLDEQIQAMVVVLLPIEGVFYSEGIRGDAIFNLFP
jgi:hypothetical protein